MSTNVFAHWFCSKSGALSIIPLTRKVTGNRPPLITGFSDLSSWLLEGLFSHWGRIPRTYYSSRFLTEELLDQVRDKHHSPEHLVSGPNKRLRNGFAFHLVFTVNVIHPLAKWRELEVTGFLTLCPRRPFPLPPRTST